MRTGVTICTLAAALVASSAASAQAGGAPRTPTGTVGQRQTGAPASSGAPVSGRINGRLETRIPSRLQTRVERTYGLPPSASAAERVAAAADQARAATRPD